MISLNKRRLKHAYTVFHLPSISEKTLVVLYFLRQNEEVLKKCAQEYLARVKQEEQRYQTLKLHAEEKLDKYVQYRLKGLQSA